MLHGEQRDCFDLSFCLPSECADRLQDGRADVGIGRAIERVRQELVTPADTAIICRGDVRSILLISKTPFEKIRTVAADSSSRTSVALTEIILRKKYGAEPVMLPPAPDLAAMLEDCDAALIIGDPPLRIDPSELPYRVLHLEPQWPEMPAPPLAFPRAPAHPP